MTFESGYIILLWYIGNCEEGKQYPPDGCAERERQVEAPGKRAEKSSWSIGLKEE